MNSRRTAGIGAVAFGVLTFAGLMLESPPGGTYSTKDIANFTKSSHRPLVLAGMYLMVLGAIGLMIALGHLRQGVRNDAARRVLGATTMMGGLGLAFGAALAGAVPMALMVGGGRPIADDHVTFMFSQLGDALLLGVAAATIGLSLLTLAACGATKGWLRVATYVGGVGGLLGILFLPFLLTLLWGVATGVALLSTGAGRAAVIEIPEQASSPQTAVPAR